MAWLIRLLYFVRNNTLLAEQQIIQCFRLSLSTSLPVSLSLSLSLFLAISLSFCLLLSVSLSPNLSLPKLRKQEFIFFPFCCRIADTKPHFGFHSNAPGGDCNLGIKWDVEGLLVIKNRKKKWTTGEEAEGEERWKFCLSSQTWRRNEQIQKKQKRRRRRRRRTRSYRNLKLSLG